MKQLFAWGTSCFFQSCLCCCIWANLHTSKMLQLSKSWHSYGFCVDQTVLITLHFDCNNALFDLKKKKNYFLWFSWGMLLWAFNSLFNIIFLKCVFMGPNLFNPTTWDSVFIHPLHPVFKGTQQLKLDEEKKINYDSVLSSLRWHSGI